MEYCSVYCKWLIAAHHYCVKFMFLVILNQNIFSSLMMRAEQPVTHMRSTNSKPQPSNQFPTDKIKPRPTFVLAPEAFHSDIRHNREEKTSTTFISYFKVWFPKLRFMSDEKISVFVVRTTQIRVLLSYAAPSALLLLLYIIIVISTLYYCLSSEEHKRRSSYWA